MLFAYARGVGFVAALVKKQLEVMAVCSQDIEMVICDQFSWISSLVVMKQGSREINYP